jgi:hypothetical protein
MMFWKVAGTNSFTAGEFVTLAGLTNSSISSQVALGNARDLGIGMGPERPEVAVVVGTAFTSSLATATYNIQFIGSTNGTTFTTYSETGAMLSASLAAGSILHFDVPPRPPGAALPLYYYLNIALVTNGTASISTGTLVAGIVLAAPDSSRTMGQYSAGFTVA